MYWLKVTVTPSPAAAAPRTVGRAFDTRGMFTLSWGGSTGSQPSDALGSFSLEPSR